MIHEVDDVLRALIKRDVLDGSEIEISFEAPSRDWAAKRTKPTINIYLYDIREDLSRREVFFEEVRDETGRVIDRRQPPRRFRLTYLMTAWTQRPEDEHRILSQLLGCFLVQDFLPPDLLVGSLKDSERVVVSTVAVPVGQDKQISEVWSALGGELKPSLDLAIIAPMSVGKTMHFGPPVTELPRFVVARPDAIEVGSDDSADGPDLIDGGAAADGRGRHTGKSVAKAGATAGAKGGKTSAVPSRDTSPAAVSAASKGPWAAEETIRAGAAGEPGRVIRIRHKRP
ncbi:MAG: DUF4255 domain-containing protein [Ilumatobacteraceae bacterium]